MKQASGAECGDKLGVEGGGFPSVMRMSHRPHGDWASDITAAFIRGGKQFLTNVLHC